MDDMAANFANAPGQEISLDPRTPCLLLLDTSFSMGERFAAGARTVVPIDELNAALTQFLSELRGHAKARASVELAAVTFGGRPTVALDWTPLDACAFRTFQADGDTPLGAAMEQGLEMVRKRTREYQQRKLLCHRPWVVVLTDGQPTDSSDVYDRAAAAARQAEANKDATVFIFSIDQRPETTARLQKLTARPVQVLLEANFPVLFEFLSKSLRKISSTRSVDSRKDVEPPDPKYVKAWMDV